jgi:hypothetical protein
MPQMCDFILCLINNSFVCGLHLLWQHVLVYRRSQIWHDHQRVMGVILGLSSQLLALLYDCHLKLECTTVSEQAAGDWGD